MEKREIVLGISKNMPIKIINGKKKIIIEPQFNPNMSIEEGYEVLKKMVLLIMGPGYEFKD